MLRRVFRVSMAFVALVVGAGFASGQEMMQYFVAFGMPGLWGAGISGATMLLAGYATLQLASYLRAKEHTAVFDRVSRIALTSRVLDVATTATCFITGFVMLAAAGSNLNQQFGLDLIWGSLIMLALILVAGMFDIEVVSRLIGALTPFIIILLVIAGVQAVTTHSAPLDQLHDTATQIRGSMPGWMHVILPHWFVSALNYVGMNLMVGVSMAIVIGGTNLSPRAAGIGGLIGGSFYGFLVVLISVSLYIKAPEVKDSDLPMLELVNQIHPALGVVMALVVFGMIFNTGIGMFYALGKRLSAHRPERFRLWFTGSLAVGFAISFIGFKQLLAVLYPLIGYFGILLIVVVVIGWFRGRERINEETERRDHVRSLVVRRLDPRMRFTKGDARRLRKAVDESNMDDRELRDAVYEEVVDDLVADDEIDFPEVTVDGDQSFADAATAAADEATIVYPEDDSWEERPDDEEDADADDDMVTHRYTLKSAEELEAETAERSTAAGRARLHAEREARAAAASVTGSAPSDPAASPTSAAPSTSSASRSRADGLLHDPGHQPDKAAIMREVREEEAREEGRP